MEISSYCDAGCIYCPHKVYKNNWQNRRLPLEIFEKLVPAFPKAALVHLQGWGEPFTHSGLLDMLRIAKKAGCSVGTNSNGNLLNKETIEALVNEGLDIMGFSLAGIDKKNDLIRKGTQINKVRDCIDKIRSAKAKYGTDKPKIHIAYMLLRSGLDKLDKLPPFLAELGADQTVISSLSLVVDQALAPEAMLASNEKEYMEIKKRLLEARQASEGLGTEIYFHLVSPLLTPSCCSENIGQALFVGSNGDISPCVMTQVPVTGRNYYWFEGQRQILNKLHFGNIRDDSISTIWNRKEYREFIHTIDMGGVPNICRNCYKRFIDTFASHI